MIRDFALAVRIFSSSTRITFPGIIYVQACENFCLKIFKIGISDRFVFKREAGKRLKIKTESLTSETPLVLRAGIEPARLLRTLDFESSASTNSAT